MFTPTLSTPQVGLTVVNVRSDLTLCFSYTTIVGFIAHGRTTLSENIWSATTGRHLNTLGAKASRLPHDIFMLALDNALTES